MQASTFPRLKFILIDDTKSMELMAKHISTASIVALDLEGNGRHRYPERICLIQLAVNNSIYIIDPLKKLDMSPICDLIENPLIEKVMHSVSYDVRCLKREWGIKINNLFDPAIAASFVGIKKTGLGSVIEEVLGINIDKSKKLQRSDWTIRPLSNESLLYAANDVAHLISLRMTLKKRLQDMGRYEWALEEFQRQVSATFESSNPEIDFLAVKGSGKVDPKKIPVLRSLSKLRIKYAVFRDAPLYRILNDKTLVDLANADHSIPLNLDGLGAFAFQPLKSELLNAIRKGSKSKPFKLPQNKKRPVMKPIQKKRLELLKSWRSKIGNELNIDPSLVWHAASLERIARDAKLTKNELNSPEVRVWQVQNFQTNLAEFISENGINE